MTNIASGSTYCVIALFEPLAAGTTFLRKEWPAHVTIASNFTADVHGDDVADAVHRAGAPDKALVVRLGAPAQFGRSHDIPVLLVDSPEVTALHERLANQLEGLSGFTAHEPAFWRSGYRPHLTLGAAVNAREGESRTITSIAVARLTGDTAQVGPSFDLT